MDKTELVLYRLYYEMVAEGRAEPLTCGKCQAIVLYYVDDEDRVYLKCLGCDKVTYPGKMQLRAVQEEVNGGFN